MLSKISEAHVQPTQRGSIAPQAKPVIVLSMISKLKSKGTMPGDMPETKPTGPTRRGVVNKHQLKQIYTAYQQKLVQSNALDFDDIILVTLQLLRRDKGTHT